MKTKDNKHKKTPRLFNLTRWRKLYVSAIEANPGDFSEAEPSGNLARIFVVLLLVHVFLIGSIVVYNIVAERPRLDHAITATPPVKPKSLPAKPTTPKPVEVVKSAPATPVIAPAPSPAVDLRVYEVGSGDSIPSIAAKFGADSNELLTLNHLDDGGEIYPGKKLRIPAKTNGNQSAGSTTIVQSLPVAAFINTPPSPAKSNFAQETNKPTDTVPKATLVKAPLAIPIQEDPPKAEKKPEKPVVTIAPPAAKPAQIKQPEKPADKTSVEKKSASAQTYTTSPKDTFYSVAKKYKVKVDDLMRLNGVSDPSKLRAGMKLKIPAKD